MSYQFTAKTVSRGPNPKSKARIKAENQMTKSCSIGAVCNISYVVIGDSFVL